MKIPGWNNLPFNKGDTVEVTGGDFKGRLGRANGILAGQNGTIEVMVFLEEEGIQVNIKAENLKPIQRC